MATADKSTTVAENVPKVYHAGQMTVVENAECLKGSKTDTAMLIDDVSPVEHTMGVKVHGKNLLPPADGGIYYNGSIAGGRPFISDKRFSISDFNNINISSYRGVYAVIKLKEGKTYTLTVNNLVNNCATQQIKLAAGFRSSESTVFGVNEIRNCVVSSDYNPSSFTFTVPSGYPYCLVGFYNYPTVSGDTISFNAMQLELGTKATDYEPYNSDIQNVHSKNLIPYPYAETTKTVNGVTFTDNGNGTITVNGTTPSDSGASFMLSNIDIPIKAGTYSTSGCVSGSNSLGDNIMIMIVAQDDNYNMYDLSDTGSNKTTTIVNDSHIINLSIQIPPDITLNNAVFKPQLEYGSTATAYTKYHEPYPLVVSRYGKNLLNLSNREIVTNTWSPNTAMRNFNGNQLFVGISANNYFVTPNIVSYSIGETITVTAKQSAYGLGYDVAVKPNTSYVFSSITTNGEIRVGLYNKDGTYSRMIAATNTFTTNSTEYWAVIVLKQLNGNESIEVSFTDIQLELTATATAYEPYIAPTEYTPNANGTVEGVESLYPSTTLLTNDPYGKVYIDCGYYKDIDKTFNELTTSVALSGGE